MRLSVLNAACSSSPCLIPPKQALPIAAKKLRCLHAATSPPPHSQPQNRCPRCRSVDVLDIGESMSSTSVQRLWKSPKRLSGRAPNQDVAKSPPSHLSSPLSHKKLFLFLCRIKKMCFICKGANFRSIQPDGCSFSLPFKSFLQKEMKKGVSIREKPQGRRFFV